MEARVKDLWNEARLHKVRATHFELDGTLGEIALDAFHLRWELVARNGRLRGYVLLDNGEAVRDDWFFACEPEHPFARSLEAFTMAAPHAWICGQCEGQYSSMTEFLLGMDYLCPICRYA
jgi:hypothetical protein